MKYLVILIKFIICLIKQHFADVQSSYTVYSNQAIENYDNNLIAWTSVHRKHMCLVECTRNSFCMSAVFGNQQLGNCYIYNNIANLSLNGVIKNDYFYFEKLGE